VSVPSALEAARKVLDVKQLAHDVYERLEARPADILLNGNRVRHLLQYTVLM
jgi:hypothetical protein